MGAMIFRLPFLLLLTSALLLTLPTSAAKLKLNADDIQAAIRYGQRFESQRLLAQHLGRLGYHKTDCFLVGCTEVFLITDFVRVAAHSAAVQRQGDTLRAHTIQENLQGKLDVLVLIYAEHGYLVAKPIISIEHADGTLSPESVTEMKVYPSCRVLSPVLFVNWSELCHAMGGDSSAWEERGMWLFSFSLPEQYWNSEIKLVLGTNSGKAAKVEFDFSSLQ
ncbi:hypothetical protein MYX77_06035 [Acidobacteriia bacterium AH_259_A11_L15]|nr:hypothetical protein [Acidobacteriia bacterium AH_259_A11_L15]